MSEPDQLFVRVHVDAAALAAARDVPIRPAVERDDWRVWTDTLDWGSPADVDWAIATAPNGITFDGMLLEWRPRDPLLDVVSDGAWEFAVVMFSANLRTTITFLNGLRQVLEDAGASGWGAVMPYLWGEPADASPLITAHAGHTSVATDVPVDVREYTALRLGELTGRT